MTRCGRPKKNGSPCRALRARTQVVSDPQRWEAPACAKHMDPAEHREYQAAIQRAIQAEREFFQARPVACGSWPVTDTDRERARAASECSDPEEADRLGLALLSDWQDGRCAICGGRDNRVIDHDHATGLVRGLLCPSCNTREGFARAGDAYDRYGAQNPAATLGLSIRYWNPFGGYAKPMETASTPIDEAHPVFVLADLYDAEPLPQERSET